jgi:hypothetical protein
MKIRILFSVCISIFFLNTVCFADTEAVAAGLGNETQWPKYIFPSAPPKGRVKTITETAFTVDSHVEGVSRNFMYKLILRYSSGGLLLSEEYYDENGNNGNRVDYTYENGLLTLKTQSHPDVNNPDREIFTMLPDGRITETEKIFSRGNYGWKFLNSFDNKGRIVLTSKYDRYWNWMLVYSRMFGYDDRGRLSSTEGFGMKNELLWRDEYSYNGDGWIAESRKYNPDGDLVVRIRNEYNPDGFIARREFFDMDGNSYAVYAYGWNTDDEGNWTEKVTGREIRGSSGVYLVPDSMLIRSIEYYE